MNVAAVIARYLKAAGIGHVFGYPGDSNVELIEALRRHEIDFVLARREGTAAFMAQAYGQITGRPGVCVSTLGPGASSLVNGVANALLDRVPMIAISGQIETARSAGFTHQVLDHALLFAPISKWTAEMGAGNAGAVMRRGLRTAIAERPGPVHLTTPADVIAAEATDDAVVLPPLEPASGSGMQVFRTHGAPAPEAMIAGARRPVILAGIAAARAAATPALVRLAETLHCPVVAAPMAKGVMPEDHRLYAGTLDMACNTLIWDFLAGADLIVAAGFDAVELIKPWSLRAAVLHLDAVPNTDQVYAAEVEMVGAIPAMLDALADSCGGEARWPAAEIAAHKQALETAYYAGRIAGNLNPTDVIDVVHAAMPADAIATCDVGSHKLLVGQGWRTTLPGGVLMTNGLSSMGYGLPAAITAQMLAPDRRVVALIGDGGFAMVQGELRLAASLGLGLTVVVFVDNELNRITLKQTTRQYPTHGTTMDPTDIARVAEAMGCRGDTVGSAAALERALSSHDPDRPHVIAAEIDPAQYMAQF